MVFQHFNLFPHMTALENVIAAPRLRAEASPSAQAAARATSCSTASASPTSSTTYPVPALRRPAAARRDRPRAGDGAEADAVRRADLGARPRAGRRRARRHARPRARRHDDGRRHPRDRLRARGRRHASSSWTAASIVEAGDPREVLGNAPARAHARSSRRSSDSGAPPAGFAWFPLRRPQPCSSRVASPFIPSARAATAPPARSVAPSGGRSTATSASTAISRNARSCAACSTQRLRDPRAQLACRREHPLERSVLRQQRRRRLCADAARARQPVGGVPAQRDQVGDLVVGRAPERASTSAASITPGAVRRSSTTAALSTMS